LPDDIIVVGCWGHGRRKWHDALKVVPEDMKKDSVSYKGFVYFQNLFMLERKYKKRNLSAEERKEERLKYSLPIAKKLFAWVKTVEAVPKTALGKAITYTINQQSYLMNIFLDGRLELSNNRCLSPSLGNPQDLMKSA